MQEPLSVLILYNLPETTACKWSVSTYGVESQEGVIDEVRVVADAMARLGGNCRAVGISRLTDVPAVLASAPEPVVFNLVEGLIGNPQDTSEIPGLCQAFGKMATGCDSTCLSITLNKWRAKSLLNAAGVPVPQGLSVPIGCDVPMNALPEGPLIVKPAESDASEGIGVGSVFKDDRRGIPDIVRTIHREFRQPALIEQYVGNREFNVSIVQDGDKVLVMPVAEIDFTAFEPDRPRIIDYAAKWLPDTFEFNNTPRLLPAPISPELAVKISAIALNAWKALACRDFARVDMRMDEQERVYVLEINANPDISLDAGLMAAMGAASIKPEEFIRMIVTGALTRLQAIVPARVPETTEYVQGGCSVKVRCTERADRDGIIDFVRDSGYFRPDEIAIAAEVLDDAILKGPEGHYQSFTAESAGRPVGWICFGPTPCTLGTFDIYWIAVSSALHRKGIGRTLLRHAETLIAARGGRLSIIETSGKGLYDSTREFYLKMGYVEEARVTHFYAHGDDKIIYSRRLTSGSSPIE